MGMSGGGGGTQSTQTVQKADPWEGQQSYLTEGFTKAKDTFLTQPPPSFYPGSTVTPFSPETQAALQMQTNRALSGSPIQSAGTGQLTQTLNGDYLNQIGNIYNNPVQQMVNSNVIAPTLSGDYLYGGDGFNAAVDAATRKTLPMVDSAFERSGRTGSGLASTARTQAIADAFAGQYGQERQNQLAASQLGQAGTETLLNNIGKERDNQIRSMLVAPQIASLDYQDISKLAEVGGIKENLSQQQKAEDIARYDYGQNADEAQLAKYMNLIQGNYGSTGTANSTSNLSGGGGSNPILGGLGGLLGAGMMGMNPLMGLFSGLLGGF